MPLLWPKERLSCPITSVELNWSDESENYLSTNGENGVNNQRGHHTPN